jgi:8-oxo-dGTP diphosphatase
VHEQNQSLVDNGEYPRLPRVAVGGLIIRNERVLLVERGKAPAKGLWAVPGGSVLLGETLQAAVEREVLEETGIVVRAGDPIYTFDAIQEDGERKVRFHYVIIDLRATYVSGEPTAGDDATQCGWVSAEESKGLPMGLHTRRFLHRFAQWPMEMP